MHLRIVGIEPNVQFVDSTSLRKFKFESLKCIPNSGDGFNNAALVTFSI